MEITEKFYCPDCGCELKVFPLGYTIAKLECPGCKWQGMLRPAE